MSNNKREENSVSKVHECKIYQELTCGLIIHTHVDSLHTSQFSETSFSNLKSKGILVYSYY